MSQIARCVILVCTLLLGNQLTIQAQTQEERIDEIVLERYEHFEMELPYPEVVIVDQYHWAVRGPVIGRAVMFSDGDEVIYLQQDKVNRENDLINLLDHEISHVKYWREYGVRAAIRTPHGINYKRICREYANRRSSCSPYAN